MLASRPHCYLILSALYAGCLFAGPYDRSAEVDLYRGLLQSDKPYIRQQAAEDLSWVGLSDTALFDVLASRIRAELASPGGMSAEELFSAIAALGGSGQLEYQPLLQKLADSTRPGLAQAADRALLALDQSSRWNLMISDGSRVSQRVPFSIAMYLNMLAAQEPGLVQRGAQQIKLERLQNENVLNAMAERLQQGLEQEHDEAWLQAYASLCEALAYAGGPAYRKLLQQTAKSAADKELRKAAKGAIKTYF